jgi:hypothetical protein
MGNTEKQICSNISFFAHEHSDSFRIISDASKPLASLFVAPSMTTFQNYNPSVRMYEYSSTEKAVTNYVQYFSNITQNNEQGFVSYTYGYDFQTLYNVTDMSPQTFANVLDEIALYGNTCDLFELWFNNKAEPIDCSQTCRAVR